MTEPKNKPGRPRDDARADAMRAYYIRGASLRQVGKKFKVSGTAVKQIFKRRSWPIRRTRLEEKE